MAEDQRFDDREVGLILKRVAELHESESPAAHSRALTRSELEDVVEELGFERALVARAVSELSIEDVRNQSSFWLGGKHDLMLEHRIERKLSEAELGAMVEVLRRHLGDPGRLRKEANAHIWSPTESGSRAVNFTVVEDASGTTLRLEESLAVPANSTVGGASGIGAFGGFMSIVPFKALLGKTAVLLGMGPVTLVGATLGWLIGRRLWRGRSAKAESELRSAFGEIVGLADAPMAALSEG